MSHKNEEVDVFGATRQIFAPGDLPAPATCDPAAIAFRDDLANQILEDDPFAVSTLGYVPRVFSSTTLPYEQPKEPDGTLSQNYVRKSSKLTLTLHTLNPQLGLPYGSLPRLIFAYLTEQAVKTKSRDIDMCNSISDLLKQFGMVVCGGKAGTVTRLRYQLEALRSTTVLFEWAGDYKEHRMSATALYPIFEQSLFWERKGSPDYLQGSYIRLSEYVFKEISQKPIPVDFKVYVALKRSPMAMDLYTFLTYRVSYLRKEVLIPWEGLHVQFGYDYKNVREFRRVFLRALKVVSQYYTQIRFDTNEAGLILKPSPTHIPRHKPMDIDMM